MLRNIGLILVGVLLVFLAACSRNDIKSLSKNEVYFFYQDGCPHCQEADLYIKKNFANAKIKAINIKTPGNLKLFSDAIYAYNITEAAGTPLICMGENYIMGWGSDDRLKFHKLILPYLGK